MTPSPAYIPTEVISRTHSSLYERDAARADWTSLTNAIHGVNSRISVWTRDNTRGPREKTTQAHG
jgi:hypothetical protein